MLFNLTWVNPNWKKKKKKIGKRKARKKIIFQEELPKPQKLSFVLNRFSAFRYFLLYISSLLIVFIILLNFSQIVIYLSKIFSSFIIKNTLILIWTSFTYTHFYKEYVWRSNFFIIFVTNITFRIFFTKRKLNRYCYFINIYNIDWNRTFILMKFVFFNFSLITFYNFFYPFLYMILIFYVLIYNFLLFSEVNLEP